MNNSAATSTTRLLSAGLAAVVTFTVQNGAMPAFGSTEEVSKVGKTVDLLPSAEARADAVAAMITAQATDQPVEDLSARTETSSTYANPDGSWTIEQTSQPIRVQSGNGTWSEVETALVERGSVYRSASVPTDISFGGGGNSIIATLDGVGAGQLEWTWPEELPRPIVDGSTLTYPDVLPNADLVITAQVAGFSQSVVLRAPPESPRQFDIPISVRGADLNTTVQDGLSVKSPTGNKLAVAPAPLMWDSAASVDEDALVKRVDLSVDKVGGTEQYVLRPDSEFLTDPGTDYPVVIDPTFTTYGTGDAWVQNSQYTSAQTSTSELRVGTYDGGTHKARSFLRFNGGDWKNKHIINAELRMRNFQSLSCASSPIRVNRITEPWSFANLSWANQPSFTGTGSSTFGRAYGYGPDCEAGDAVWDITQIVSGWADGAIPNYGLRLKADDEDSNASWRKYRSQNFVAHSALQPRIAVTYNSYPDKASTPRVLGARIVDSTYYSPSSTPTLSTIVHDQDANRIRAKFFVGTGTTTLWSGWSPTKNSGASLDLAVPAGTLGDGTYSVTAIGDDGTDLSPSQSQAAKFVIDTVAPALPSVRADQFVENGWTDAASSNAFSVTPPNGASSVYEYEISKDEGQWITQRAGTNGGTVVNWNPANGTHTLRIIALDKAGNASPVRTFQFGVGGAHLTSPADDARSSDEFSVVGAAPPGATSASLEWRASTDSQVWQPALRVSTASGAPWAGSVLESPTASATPDLVWAAGDEPALMSPSLVELRLCFQYSSGSDSCTTPRRVTLVPYAVGGGFSTREIGPGVLSLSTGDFVVSHSDFSDRTVGLSRAFHSFGPPVSEADLPFGPGWSSDLSGYMAGASDMGVIDTTVVDGMLTFISADGTSLNYAHESGASVGQAAGQYLPVGETASYGNRVAVRPGGPIGIAYTLTLEDSEGTVTTWYYPTAQSDWYLARVDSAAAEDSGSFAYDRAGRVTWIGSLTTFGGTCNIDSQSRACRALDIQYDSAGHVIRVDLVAYDPRPGDDGLPSSGAGVVRKTVAKYAYNAEGLLVEAWDPRFDSATGGSLKTSYSYGTVDGHPVLASITEPGQMAWRLDYDHMARLIAVRRALPDGSSDSVQTVLYDVPVAGSGLPDLSASSSASWGQEGTATPSEGTALFPASHVPSAKPSASDWVFADITYVDHTGRETNQAQYGAGGWQIDTVWYDQVGNVSRSLTAGARALALDSNNSRQAALDFASVTLYNGDGTRVEEEWSPAHISGSSSGALELSRSHTSYVYDDEAPQLAAGRPTNDEPYDLVVEERRSASNADMTADWDHHLTRYEYAPLAPGDASGWDLFMATKILIRLDGGTWQTQQETRYDSEGKVIEQRQPDATVDPSGYGNDARTTRTTYYQDGVAAIDPRCSFKAEWAGLPCLVGPAGPASSGAAPPVVHFLGYDINGNVTSVEHRAAGATRRIVTSTDDAGRVTGQSVTTSGLPQESRDVASSSLAYSSATGLPTSFTRGNLRIEKTYDSWGRETSYSDSDGGSALTTYTADGDVATFDDGRRTVNYHYNGIDANGQAENRGLVTRVDTGVSSDLSQLSYAYNDAGSVAAVSAPGGLVATLNYDSWELPTSVSYARSGYEILSFAASHDAQGRTVRSDSARTTSAYQYDAVGRLASVVETQNNQCSEQNYSYDTRSNRTELTSTAPMPVSECGTGMRVKDRSWTYDTADRVVTVGYSYDDLGRTTAVPAEDTATPTGSTLRAAYFSNDMIAELSQSIPTADGMVALKSSYSLDATLRIRQIINTIDGSEKSRLLYRYGDGSDRPTYVDKSLDGGTTWRWQRTVRLPTGPLGMTEDDSGFVTLQLTNLHGDVVADVDPSSAVGLDAYTEYDAFGAPSSSMTSQVRRYGWHGAALRSTDSAGGLVLMGSRVYNPVTGRFLTRDIILDANLNAYTYPPDPINQSDIDGRCPVCIIAALISSAHMSYALAKRIKASVEQAILYLAYVGYTVYRTYRDIRIKVAIHGPHHRFDGYWSWIGLGGWRKHIMILAYHQGKKGGRILKWQIPYGCRYSHRGANHCA